MRHRPRIRIIAPVCIILLLAAGCSSSKKTANGSMSSPGGTSATTASSTSKVSGAPYELMWQEVGVTTADQYISVIEDGVNARGGIDGHPLKIVDCKDNVNPNLATQCARDAVANPRMLGLMANGGTCGSQLLQTLASAHMASIGDQFFCPEDFKSPQVFPFNAGFFDNLAGLAIMVKLLNNPNVVATTLDAPAGRAAGGITQAVITPVGGKLVGATYIPLTATDMAPYAADIASHKGTILLEGNITATGIRLDKALAQQGYNQPMLYTGTTWDAATIQQNFGNPTNRYLSESFNLTSTGYKLFDSDMKTYAPGATYRATDLLSAWLAANVVANIAKQLPTVTAQSVFNYLSSATNLDTFGLTPPIDFTATGKAMGGLIPRATNLLSALYKYENGSLVEVTPFENGLP